MGLGTNHNPTDSEADALIGCCGMQAAGSGWRCLALASSAPIPRMSLLVDARWESEAVVPRRSRHRRRRPHIHPYVFLHVFFPSHTIYPVPASRSNHTCSALPRLIPPHHNALSVSSSAFMLIRHFNRRICSSSRQRAHDRGISLHDTRVIQPCMTQHMSCSDYDKLSAFSTVSSPET